MNEEKKSRSEQFPNIYEQILILILILHASNPELIKVETLVLEAFSSSDIPAEPIVQQDIEKFPPNFLNSELVRLRPEDVGKFVVVKNHLSANVPNDQIKMRDRLIVKIESINEMKLDKGTFQFFEGSLVVKNLDNSYYLGRAGIYAATQILYFLDQDDSTKINK